MSVLALVKDSHPILRQTQPVFDFDNPVVPPESLVNDLLETMRSHGAVGLAAPQVNLPYRVFVMEVPGMAARACFNPVVIGVSDDSLKDNEGCLSFPGLFLKISRPISISVRYQNFYGNFVNETFDNLAARCYLHETDHLNGVRFIEKVGAVTLMRAKQNRSKNILKGQSA